MPVEHAHELAGALIAAANGQTSNKPPWLLAHEAEEELKARGLGRFTELDRDDAET